MDDALDAIDALKVRLTKFESNFKKCSNANRTKGYLEGRLIGIKEIWKNICETDAKITTLKTDQNANDDYFENDEFGEMEEKYFVLVGQINEYLSAFNPQPNLNQNQNANNNRNQNQNQNQQDNSSKVKLPKISLPMFDGSYHTWLSFKNRFTNLIHNSASLAPSEKLEYLKSCVTDKAERKIRRFQITDQNYALAWDHLNEEYDNQRILQATQAEMIIDRRSIKTESARELRELIDVTQECLESLKILNVDISTWDIMLIVLITRKLPLRTRELWEEELKPKDVPTYQPLCEFLEKRYRTLESLELISKSESEYCNESRLSQPKYQRFNCIVCNIEPHLLTKCDEFLDMSVSSRNSVVNSKNICKNCLGTNHSVSECRNQKRCFKCGNRHHTLIHQETENSSNQNQSYSQHSNQDQFYSQPTQYSNNRVRSQTYLTNQSNRNNEPTQHQHSHQRNPIPQSNQQPQNQQSTQDNPTNQDSYSNNRRALTTMSNSTSFGTATNPLNDQVSQKQTLFPTAIIKVKSADGTIHNLRALLDQCSDEAYIKESVAKMLGLKQTPVPALDVTGLCDTVTSIVTEATKFEMIIQQTESMEVEAKIVETLIELLPNTTVAWPKDLFKNIQLADPTFATPGNIDIMLGGQQYAELLLDGMLKKNGFLAQNTKLGWIISGKGNNSNQPIQRSNCLITKTTINSNETLEKLKKIKEKPRQKSFCGFTQSRWISNEKRCEESMQRNIQQNRIRYVKPNNLKRYYPIFRTSNFNSILPQSSTNRLNQPNANQSKNQAVNRIANSINSDDQLKVVRIPTLKSTYSESSSSTKKHIQINDQFFGAPRISLINNRLMNSHQISKITENFAQRWRSESLLATTSIMRPIQGVTTSK